MRRNDLDAPTPPPARLRCAIYTRKSTEEGLDQEFNSLDAQREAGEAFIQSQRREGWVTLPELYDDGGFTGANNGPARSHETDPCRRGSGSCRREKLIIGLFHRRRRQGDAGGLGNR